LKIGHYC